jgi:hypothetical protein
MGHIFRWFWMKSINIVWSKSLKFCILFLTSSHFRHSFWKWKASSLCQGDRCLWRWALETFLITMKCQKQQRMSENVRMMPLFLTDKWLFDVKSCLFSAALVWRKLIILTNLTQVKKWYSYNSRRSRDRKRTDPNSNRPFKIWTEPNRTELEPKKVGSFRSLRKSMKTNKFDFLLF